MNLEVRRNIYDDKGKKIAVLGAEDKERQANGAARDEASETAKLESASQTSKKPFKCFTCGIDCTKLRFHYTKATPATANPGVPDAKYDLCPNCFLQGRLPSSHQASDFVKLEDSQYTRFPDRDAPWTDSELLLLLEGLENFDDDWSQIAQHVGTRSAEECVMKFLQLEIEDKYLEDTTASLAGSSLDGGLQPINQTENPVLSVVAHLAQMTQPSVAAAASGRTVAEVQRILRDQIEERGGGGGADKSEKERKAETAETPKQDDQNAMDIDGAQDKEQEGPKNADGAKQEDQASRAEKPGASPAVFALATSAARAAVLASHEEREMTRLVSAAVNTTLQKLELKIAQFSEIEQLVEAERRDLEIARQQLVSDRLAVKKGTREVQEIMRRASQAATPEEAAAIAAEANLVGFGDGFGAVRRDDLDAAGGSTQQSEPPSASAGSGDFKAFEI